MLRRFVCIYTRTGDKGTSGVFGTPQRLPKWAAVFHACGDVDELSSSIGVARTQLEGRGPAAAIDGHLRTIQGHLQDLSSLIASHQAPATHARLQQAYGFGARIGTLEGWIDGLAAELAPLSGFILPGGAGGAAQLHLARAVCRRAERTCHELNAGLGAEGMLPVAYLNRLSDYLFTAARRVAPQEEYK